jgi:hypothetical protein
MINFDTGKRALLGARPLPYWRVMTHPFRDFVIATDRTTGRKMIVTQFEQSAIEETKAEITKMQSERKKQNYNAPVSRSDELNGHLAEQAFSTWLLRNSTIPANCWHAETKKLTDKHDFWLIRDGETVLTIDPKSTYLNNLARAELQINLEQFENHKSEIYLLVQVLLKERIARIIGYVYKDEVSKAQDSGHITTEIKGEKCRPFIHLKPRHSVDELVSLFNEKLDTKIELDGKRRDKSEYGLYGQT